MSGNHGVLVLHKPAGVTSHDCVAKVRRLFKTKRVGHTGTLDPEVTGVLPICLGNATRIVEYLQDHPKTYEVIMRLGISTTTEDAGGERISQVPVDSKSITEEKIKALFARFIGDIEQVPPMYSAVKVNGQRLYDLARQGMVVERKARTVTIHELKLHEISQGDEETVLVSFSCRCSKGTYIRTLCVDLGLALGYPAHMARLVRTESGGFTLNQSIPLAELEQKANNQEDLSGLLVSIGEALSFLPRFQVPPNRKAAVLNGLETALPGVHTEAGSLICLFANDQLLGIHRVYQGPNGLYAKPEKVFQS